MKRLRKECRNLLMWCLEQRTVTQKECAIYMGVSQTAVSRQLKKFQELGIMRKDHIHGVLHKYTVISDDLARKAMNPAPRLINSVWQLGEV